jgi:predicted transcriptional regulator
LTFEYQEAIPRLQVLADIGSHKIILSTIDSARTAQQIASENNLPLSSTYKKIRRLLDMDILRIERVNIDESGKRVLYYKSKVKSLEFSLKREGTLLQLEKNDKASRCTSTISKTAI